MKYDLEKEGVKYDEGKLRYDLIPADAMDELAKVYTVGSKKYDDNNWRKGMKWGKVFAALMRHMWAFWGGELLDPEDGIHHTIHAAWNCFTLFNYTMTQKQLDDRIKHRNLNEGLEYDPKDVSFANIKKELKEINCIKPRIYLAGCVIEEEYRKYVSEKYGNKLCIFDPMKEIDEKVTDISHVKYMEKSTKLDDSVIEKIVTEDKQAIEESDILIAYMTRYSAGTIMEIEHAHNCEIPVYIIDPSCTFRNDVWIYYHANVFFDNIDTCFEHVLS